MKYVKQFLIIIGISLAGEILKYILPLPIPASIYGMAILFIALLTGIIKLKDVRETGKFLIEIMPLMFIPAGVGLMPSWGVLKPLLPSVLRTFYRIQEFQVFLPAFLQSNHHSIHILLRL